MSTVAGEARLTSFLVKVASRCNLDCDYCYVYHHADQSWRSMPPVLSQADRDAFALQLSAYVRHAGLRHCVVVLHGGEPLLMGVSDLVRFAHQLRQAVGSGVKLDISMQTNGLLLTKEVLGELTRADIGVSLSLDGPKDVNDLHRTSRKGRSSFDKTLRALELLKEAPAVFAGVIAVIDARTDPRNLLEFFNAHKVPRLDFLLPDAHHLRPPPGRAEHPDRYESWLIRAFDLWLDEYPNLQVRTFEALLDAVAGLPSQTDAFGFGDVSLITVETDGTYHDLDVLKVVGQGATKLIGGVRDTSIADIAGSPALAAHRQLLRKEGLCATCQQCDVAHVCGGGAVPHRHGLNGFLNPTVYCREMKALIRHAKKRVVDALAESPPRQDASPAGMYSGSLAEFERAEHAGIQMNQLWADALADQKNDLKQAILLFSADSTVSRHALRLLQSEDAIDVICRWPGAVAWSRTMLALEKGVQVNAVDGTPLQRDAHYVGWLLSEFEKPGTNQLQVNRPDPWLRRPFGTAITFEADDSIGPAGTLLSEALEIIDRWRPALAKELKTICNAIQFIRDPSAHPDKIVSFSDNAVPGALFVSIRQQGELLSPYDLADSLVHEYRHQKLYLLERKTPTVEATAEKIVSPWREDLRPPSGLFHAIFVFVELRRFWKHVQSSVVEGVKQRAENQIAETNRHLETAFRTLAECRLTPVGIELAKALEVGSRD